VADATDLGDEIIDPNAGIDIDSETPSTDEIVDDGVVDETELGSDESTVEDDSDRYTIKVDGEEIEVTLDELLNGYSRQSDYTRKTQELAQQRQQLETLAQFEQALARDPQAAIKALAQVYGIGELGNQASVEELDPIEREVRELRQLVSQQQEAQRVAQITTEAAQAISAAKLEVGPQELIQFAYENQIGRLDVAARLMAQEGRANARKVEVVKKTAGKRAASVVAGGGNSSTKTTQAPAVNSIRDAFAQALAEARR